MENLNLVELLRDCPKGMELDCTMYNKVTLLSVDNSEDTIFPIRVLREDGCVITLTEYGQYADAEFAKCVIFPKGKTTWEGFVPPCKFKDGDILYVDGTEEDDDKQYDYIFIFNEIYNGQVYSYCHCYIPNDDFKFRENEIECLIDDKYPIRLATEEEKQKLFDAIKANGYKWNAKTKTLEKLVEPKFNLATLKPFEGRVLVRDYDNRMWMPTFWGKRLECDSNCSYLTTNGCYKYCIPYENNQHLLGTNNDCDDFYKTWEK